MDTQEALALACFAKIEERMERCFETQYDQTAIQQARGLVRSICVRSGWAAPNTQFALGEYSLILVDDELTDWMPIIYVQGVVNPDGSLQIILDDDDYPRMFFGPQVETDENDDEFTQMYTTKFLAHQELNLSVSQRARTLSNFAYLFKFGDVSPMDDLA